MTKIKQRSCRRFLAKKVLNLLAVCVLLTATAFTGTALAAETEGYLTYTLNDDNTAKITGCSDSITAEELANLVIPDTLTDGGVVYTVTEVGGFKDKKGITSVKLPSGLKKITKEAFYGCTGLVSVELPDAVTSVGDYTFCGCTGLTSIGLPKAVTKIGTCAFQNCTGLTSVELPETLKSMGQNAFRYCPLVKVIIPKNITSIPIGAFRDCKKLKEVVLPDGLKEIGSRAFQNCESLIKVTMPSCETLGSYAFNTCVDLAYMNSDYEGELVLPENLTKISTEAFRQLKSAYTIIFPDSFTTLGTVVCYRSPGLKNMYLPKALEDTDIQSIVGGMGSFKTINLFTPSASYAAEFARSGTALDNYSGSGSYKSGADATGLPLFNLITEESNIIVYDEKFTDGNGAAVTALTDKAGFSARVFNKGDTEQKLTAIISVTGADDILKGVNFYEMTLPAHSGQTLTDSNLAVKNVNFEAGDEISVMFWEDLDDIERVVTRELTLDVTDALISADS